MGNSPVESNLLPDNVIDDAVTSFGGAVVTRCKGCPNTSRVIAFPSATEATFSGTADYEVKPREIYVLTFPTIGGDKQTTTGAKGWINRYADQLKGRTIYLTDPAKP